MSEVGKKELSQKALFVSYNGQSHKYVHYAVVQFRDVNAHLNPLSVVVLLCG